MELLFNLVTWFWDLFFPNHFLPLFSLFTKIIPSLFLPLFYLLSFLTSFVLSFLKADDTKMSPTKTRKPASKQEDAIPSLKQRTQNHVKVLTCWASPWKWPRTVPPTPQTLRFQPSLRLPTPLPFSRHAVWQCHKPFRWTARVDFEVRLKSLRNETK